jgi:hypothetical protein
MTENPELNTIEKKTAVVDNWINKVTTEGIVEEIDSLLIREVLENFGANFEVSEQARVSLGKRWDKGRRLGIDAVWGQDKVKEYRIWLKDYIEDYEKRTGKRLPFIPAGAEGKPTKTAGGFKFFTDLTVFAGGYMSFEKYKSLTEERASKGRIWQTKKEGEPYPSTSTASFTPEFPSVAWNKIKTWRKG